MRRVLTGLGLVLSVTSSLCWTSRSSDIQTTHNARLDGHVIHRQRSVNMFACAHRCLLESACASFNFQGLLNEIERFCEFNSNKSLLTKVELRRADGWTYGFMRGKNWDVPKDFNFTFTTLGALGAQGPKNLSGYGGTSLESKVELNKGIQIWTVPFRGTYRIEAVGGSGGSGKNDTNTGSRRGGYGARVTGNFYLMEGTVLRILVGQVGLCAAFGVRRPGGGGGGTFVTLQDNNALVVAGGGGGGAAPWIGFHHGDVGQLTENGSTYAGGAGGTGGYLYDYYHKSFSQRFEAGAGGGLDTNGASGKSTPGGFAFKNGGEGGVGNEGAQGGFGGGGAAYLYPGGGGGYSGGGVVRATRYTVAGGGGSFSAGSMVEKSIAVHRGPGRVDIRLIKPDIG